MEETSETAIAALEWFVVLLSGVDLRILEGGVTRLIMAKLVVL